MCTTWLLLYAVDGRVYNSLSTDTYVLTAGPISFVVTYSALTPSVCHIITVPGQYRLSSATPVPLLCECHRQGTPCLNHDKADKTFLKVTEMCFPALTNGLFG